MCVKNKWNLQITDYGLSRRLFSPRVCVGLMECVGGCVYVRCSCRLEIGNDGCRGVMRVGVKGSVHQITHT